MAPQEFVTASLRFSLQLPPASRYFFPFTSKYAQHPVLKYPQCTFFHQDGNTLGCLNRFIRRGYFPRHPAKRDNPRIIDSAPHPQQKF